MPPNLDKISNILLWVDNVLSLARKLYKLSITNVKYDMPAPYFKLKLGPNNAFVTMILRVVDFIFVFPVKIDYMVMYKDF